MEMNEELSRLLDAVIEAGPTLEPDVREKLVEWDGGDVGHALFDMLIDIRLRRERILAFNTGQMDDGCVEGLWGVYEEMREALAALVSR